MKIAYLFAALLIAGCSSTVPDSPKREKPETPYPNIAVLDNLSQTIIADAPKLSGGGPDKRPLKIIVPVRSQASDSLQIQYRFEFLDGTGLPLETQQVWRLIRLEPKVQTFLEDSALDTHATNWRLEIRQFAPNRPV